MRKTILISLAALLALLALPVTAQAAPSYRPGPPSAGPAYNTPGPAARFDRDDRQAGLREARLRLAQQDARIQRGLRLGTLTPREYRSLQREVTSVKVVLKRSLRNGLSRAERVRLERLLDSVDRSIAVASNDRDGRWRGGRRG